MEEPIRTFEAEAARTAEGPIAEAGTRYKILQGQLQNAQVKAAKAKGGAEATKATQEAVALAKELAATNVPALPRLIADDVTPERLATLFEGAGWPDGGPEPRGWSLRSDGRAVLKGRLAKF